MMNKIEEIEYSDINTLLVKAVLLHVQRECGLDEYPFTNQIDKYKESLKKLNIDTEILNINLTEDSLLFDVKILEEPFKIVNFEIIDTMKRYCNK